MDSVRGETGRWAPSGRYAMNTSTAGATPKETMSHRLSSSLPKSEQLFVNRATNPSSMSKIMAIKMQVAAHLNSRPMLARMLVTPMYRFMVVMTLANTLMLRKRRLCSPLRFSL